VRWSVLATGLVIGWLPWLIEAYARFGGPWARLHAASTVMGGGLHLQNFRSHIGHTAGGPFGGIPDDDLPVLGQAWWLVMGVAVIVLIGGAVVGGKGRLLPADRIRRRGGAVAAMVGLATASQYLFLTAVSEARFLLPSYAALTVAMVAAAPSWHSVPVGRHGRPATRRLLQLATAAVALAMVTVLAQWQFAVTRRVEAHQYELRQVHAVLAQALRQEVRTKPCFVVSDFGFPVLAFAAGCQGVKFHPRDPVITLPTDPQAARQYPHGQPSARQQAPPVYVVTTTNPAATSVRPVPASTRSFAGTGAAGWWLFIASPHQVVWTP
jgi:hypothetical protein